MSNDILNLPTHVVRFLDNQERSTRALETLERIAVARQERRPAVLPKLLGIAFLFYLVAQCSMARAEQRSFYDRNGHFSGSSSTSNQGKNTSVYDRNGRFDGSVIRNSDGTTSFYDKSGHFTGSASAPRR